MKNIDENDVFYNIPDYDAQAVSESELLPIYDGMKISGDIQPLEDFNIPEYDLITDSDESNEERNFTQKKKKISVKTIFNKHKKVIISVASVVMVVAIVALTAFLIIKNGKNDSPVQVIYTAGDTHEICLANGKTFELTDVSEIEVSDSGMMLYYSMDTSSQTGKYDLRVVDISSKDSLRKEGYYVDHGVDKGWKINADGSMVCYSKTADGITDYYIYKAEDGTTELISQNVQEVFFPSQGDVVYFTRKISSVYSLHRKRLGENAENVASSIKHALFYDAGETFEVIYTIETKKETSVDVYSVKAYEEPKVISTQVSEIFLNDYTVNGNLYYFKKNDSKVEWRDFINDKYYDKDLTMKQPVKDDYMVEYGLVFTRYWFDEDAYNAAEKAYKSKLLRDGIREELDKIDLGLAVSNNYTCYAYNGMTKELATGVSLDNVLAFSAEGAPRFVYAKTTVQVEEKIQFDDLVKMAEKNGVVSAADYVMDTIGGVQGVMNECVYTWYDSTRVLKYTIEGYNAENTTFYLGTKDYFYALSDGELYLNKVTSKEIEERKLIDSNVTDCNFEEGYLYYYKENPDGETSLYRHSSSEGSQHLADNIYDYFVIEKEYVLMLSKQNADTELMDIAVFADGKYTEVDENVSLNNFVFNGKSIAYVKNIGAYETYTAGDMYTYSPENGVQKAKENVTEVFYVNKS